MNKMIWSIYKDTSGEYETWQENDCAIFFDMDIDASPENRVKVMHDGLHEVFYGNHSCMVEVSGGKFNIEQAKVAIGGAVDKDGYWGQFIERFYRRNGKFQVSMGS